MREICIRKRLAEWMAEEAKIIKANRKKAKANANASSFPSFERGEWDGVLRKFGGKENGRPQTARQPRMMEKAAGIIHRKAAQKMENSL
jgi:hypothetical protein